MEELALAITGALCRCVICESPLSIFPIFLYQGGSICGRCTLPNAIQSFCIQNLAYETIAQFVKFPCQYHSFGCEEKIIPSKMRNHEDCCKYRQYPCPMSSCTWRGALDVIHEHYADVHSSFILTDPRFELDLINRYEENFLIEDENAAFVFHISFDNREGVFYYSLYCFDRYVSSKDYVYHLEFINQFNSKTYSLPEVPVNESEYSSFDKANAPKVLIKDILEELEDPISVVCAVKIERNIEKSRKLSLQMDEGPESHLLNILECPICQEYMVPPIYQCLIGHAICNECKDNVKCCPECRGEIGNTRNFRLEQMTEHITYPCKYSNCPFTGNVDEIREHEATCILSIYNCPFKIPSGCKWSGFHTDILDHVHKQHPEETIELPVIAFICEGLDDLKLTEYNILPACGQLFMVGFYYYDFDFFWSVQYIGPKEDAKNYSFELDFKDNSGTDKRLFIKRPCNPLTTPEEMFNTDQEILTLKYNLLKPLINSGDLIYSCNIVPVS